MTLFRSRAITANESDAVMANAARWAALPCFDIHFLALYLRQAQPGLCGVGILGQIRQSIHDFEAQHGSIEAEINPAENVKPPKK